ncbi:hypothetical protein ABN584_20180 [Gloeocapsa sp. BRSZ]|uniref:hypothetical protein n=1 Tax=Gloeocapsopsis sp. IPPAS B-1203 TaxID=2049454 RepID=UPI000C178865|nr:hypothetical protein [Gloeocapsopsis sp. IPPAS B-1203]PIG91619.1 hypothetical protein CSQ79_20520 [Gloeocapsopsis sp. IPPAS B-1203]
MIEMIDTFVRFDTVLSQTAPKIASRLQPGLTAVEIEKQIAAFSWVLPQDIHDLYQWHNGLSGTSEKLNLAEKFLRLKGKWHGELAGRENEVHLLFEGRLIVAKFLPLEYALAGHRHLKLGRCLINLLPIAILNDSSTTIYCMIRLDTESPTLYCANGTNLPPIRVTEAFLSTQLQFTGLSHLVALLTDCFEQGVQPPSISQKGQGIRAVDCEIDSVLFAQLLQQFRSKNITQ